MRRSIKVEGLVPMRPADFQILLILAAAPCHAYGICRAVDEQQGGRVALEIGSLYRILNRMLTADLIEEADVSASGPQGQERRTYRITRFGRAVARAEAKRLEEVVEVARMRRLLPQGQSG